MIFSFFTQIIFYIYFCYSINIEEQNNNTIFIQYNKNYNYSFDGLKSNIIKFNASQTTVKYSNYFIHIYEFFGDVSLYGLKCIKNENKNNCDFNDNNMFKLFKNGNLIFSNKVNKNINLYINLKKIIGDDDKYYLIYPVICNEKNNKCNFNIEIIAQNFQNTLYYTLKYNEDFYIKNWCMNDNYIIKVNEYIMKKKIVIDITFFSGNSKIQVKDQYQNNYLIPEIISNTYRYKKDLNLPTNFYINIGEKFISFQSYYKIKYYFKDNEEMNNINYVTNNELSAFIIEDDKEKNYSLIFSYDNKTIENDNSDYENNKFFILIYAVNCEFEIYSLNNNETLKNKEYIQLFEKEYDLKNITSSTNEIGYRIIQNVDNDSDYSRSCMIYSSSFISNQDKTIYLHTNEKIGFKFTENIRDISFKYITIFEEDKLRKNNLYLEVIVPPCSEILLKIYVYKDKKHLILSKKMQKRRVFYLFDAYKICDFDEECIISAQISNFHNYSSQNESLKNFYSEDKKYNKDFIYIQYLNNFKHQNYIEINKFTKELSIESTAENMNSYYIFQINHNTNYELFINFEKKPKELEVYLNENSIPIDMSINGRYMLKTEENVQSYSFLGFNIFNNYFPSWFSYYLKILNSTLEIIPNENIHGYYSENENNYLKYEYTFEDNITAFNLEIFSKSTTIKIEDITGDNINCCNFNRERIYLKSSELFKFKVENPKLQTLKNRKILITFHFYGKVESHRHLRFRLLPIYYLDNIIYLNQGEEAICKPTSENKICYFYFKIPNGVNEEKVAIYGYFEKLYSKKLPLYANLLEKENLEIEDFTNLYKKENKKTYKSEGHLSFIKIESFYIKPNSYIIGYFETDGETKIRMVYTITHSNYELEYKKFILSPGEKKYYSILGGRGPEEIVISLSDLTKYGNYQGYLSIIKVSNKLLFSIESNRKIIKKVNVEEVFLMNINENLDNNKKKLFISSNSDNLCTFFLKYEIRETDKNIIDIKMNKPYIIHLNYVSYPLRFYMQVIENINELIINFKITEQNYLLTKNAINIEEYDLKIFLVDTKFLYYNLYLNMTEEENNTLDGVHEHYISDLYLIEHLTAEQIYLISFKNKNNVKEEILKKYSYMYFCLQPKDKNIKIKNSDLKIQIITIRQDNRFFPAQYKYFYTYINFPTRTYNLFSLLGDEYENYFIINISSEEIDYLNINFTFEDNLNLVLKNKTSEDLLKGQRIYYLYNNKNFNKQRIHINVNISLNNEYIETNNNKGKKRIYYTIKYFSRELEKVKFSNINNLLFPEYVFNRNSSIKKTNFQVEYDNVNELIKSRWAIVLNRTNHHSYIDSRYCLRFFNCTDDNLCDNNKYKLSIFPSKLPENKKLMHFTSSEELILKINEKEFNYKVMLFAFFEDDLGEEIVIAYESKKISHKFNYYYLWILGIVLLLLLFIFFAVLNLCLKLKEERDYYENEKENINLNSFSNDKNVKEEEEDKTIKLE